MTQPLPLAPTDPTEPVEERLADRLASMVTPAGPVRQRAIDLLQRLGRWDRATYQAVAQLQTPAFDRPLRRLSDFADHSKPWFVVAGLLALLGGPRGRRAAITGVAAIGVASLVVNQPMKRAGVRTRPDREHLGVPEPRWVHMPTSTSFPSGHSASAAAFTVAVGDALPALRVPLRAAGAVVAFSRVYTGVHYPGDVLVGYATGVVLGRLTWRIGCRVGPRR